MRLFWTVTERTTPRLRVIEAGPVAFLVLLSIALTVGASPVMTYLESAARTLHAPAIYIEAVLSAQPAAAQSGAMKPFPIVLTLALFAMWLLLNNSFAPGHVALARAAGICHGERQSAACGRCNRG